MKRLALVILLTACAHAQNGAAKCPEAPSCLTTPRCAFDEETQCNVCHCGEPGIDRGQEPPPGQAPFPNH